MNIAVRQGEIQKQPGEAVVVNLFQGARPGGAITAAALLSEFAKAYPWVHLDIAGTGWTDQARPYVPKGGVGIGVRLLTQLARDWEPAPA